MDDATTERYLARIGIEAVGPPDATTLHALQSGHLTSVPFENLDIHLGELVELTEEHLVDKIVRRRRGGFCYELNGLFAALLTALGYRVELLAARVFATPEQPGPPMDHLALRVDLDEPWLVDVGFGRNPVHPLRMASTGEQPDPEGSFALRPVDAASGDLDLLRDGEPQYRLEPRPRALRDFEPTCWYQQTSPRSPFTRGPTCSLRTGAGRVTLSGTRLVRTEHGERTERTLTEDEALATYREVFGMPLDRLPADPAQR
ncbi:arylamine N-acetyltransferase family protein [Saccharopolyspora sp. CA-218241]|uniref:arylamine N-acetyltransferase family protein n=1 Tax=Saccharopolyspora sp. CA-218241 TaxID=3240027 RepID=UPI003D9550F4